MIILFYSNQCKFSEKLLEYIKKNNLEKYFKMINIDDDIKIPDNITIVPTIIDETIEAPLEGKDAFIYVVNQKFFNHPTNNIDFWVNKTVPKLILIIGELLFILFLYGGILQIIASLVGSYAYAPLISYPNLILSMLPGMDSFNQFMPNQIYGDYDNFGGFIKIGIVAIATSFIVLIAFYIYKEVYSYKIFRK